MSATTPLVTIGMPVRNGGALFRQALESVVAQDYANLEILISDNASTDETPEIIREFQARDPRIVCVRQTEMLGIFDNFVFVLKHARGDFFMWAAHDDTRSANFVPTLLRAFTDASVVLAFGDLDIRPGLTGTPFRKDYDFETHRNGPFSRMRKQAFMQCFHCYGLWRTSVLKSIDWAFAPWWTDLPLMVSAAGKGEFRHAAGATFTYLEVIKTVEQRAAGHEKLAASPRIVNVLRLLRATWLTAWRSLPVHLAVGALALVSARQVRDIAGWSYRTMAAGLKRQAA